MKQILLMVFGLVTLLTQTVWAYNTERYVCPNTYQTVMLGDKIEQVESACGPPTKTFNRESTMTQPTESVQWVYTVRNVLPKDISQYTPQLIITFQNNKVSEIIGTNQRVSSLFPCYGFHRINIGNSKDDVRSQCGAPTFINTIEQGNSQSVKVTELVYNFGAYRPEMIFIFENGILKKISMGQLAK